ncbi:putative F-box protein At3g25460 [Chenopodium quinoa]|uniref:putative F-box protein At3g25460 n=1 Tax=Chenopodium quinoa TaxID=63459 RepID=UPI000B783317|nr:putative F-box protein At3g25460 [Chenopodium quinoa]
MRDTSSEEVENVMSLWNPSIRRSLLLPRPPYSYRQWVIMGFVPRSNDYKVVAFGGYFSTNVTSFAIYSLIDHRWRIETMTKVNRNVSVKRLQCGGGYVYLDGVAYWIGGFPNEPEYESHVVCFDFDVEEFSFVELPDAGEEVTGRIAFLLDESLAVFSVSSKKSCVWVMEKDGKGKETWRVWFSGDSNSEASDFIKDCIYMNVVILHVKNTDLIFVVLSGNAYYYNIRTQQLKQCEKTIRRLDSVCTYVESLVLH